MVDSIRRKMGTWRSEKKWWFLNLHGLWQLTMCFTQKNLIWALSCFGDGKIKAQFRSSDSCQCSLHHTVLLSGNLEVKSTPVDLQEMLNLRDAGNSFKGCSGILEALGSSFSYHSCFLIYWAFIEVFLWQKGYRGKRVKLKNNLKLAIYRALWLISHGLW